ncbi:uridine-cytidine kinase [Moritella viscosa]
MNNTSNSCVIIAIAGASASGKSLLSSTIYNELVAEFGESQIAVITEDCYYRDQSHLEMEERVKTNYDHPQAMDHKLLCSHLQGLSDGKAVEIPTYSYTEHTRIRNIIHASVFMETPLDICFIRRLQRDVAERGRTMESVIEQYNDTVRPMFLQFIEPSKQYADLIVPRGGKNRFAIDTLKAKICQLLNN